MNFHEALRAAADYLHLNGDDLIRFAGETPDFPNMPYGGMSIDREEGMFLYALARALKPMQALEIGVYQGVSSAHILAARDSNHAGMLYSIDVSDYGIHSNDVWIIEIADATTADLPPADFVYEDSNHQLPAAATILEKVKALNPRVVVSHDYFSDILYQDPVGFQVREAFVTVFGADVLGVKWNTSPRGFGLWLNPQWKLNPNMPLTSNELKGLIDGDVLEVKPNGESALKKPAPRKRAPAKRTAKK